MVDPEIDLELRFRPRIEGELAELLAHSQSSAPDRSPVELDQQSVGRLSRMDAMLVQAMALAAERRRQGRIVALRAALARMDSDDYGYCASCDEPIALGRLDVDPAVQRCVSCARGGEP